MPYAKEQKWKCNICGGIVMIVEDGEGTLVCCDKPMELVTSEAPKPGEKIEEKAPTEPPKPKEATS